jgi:hypothetical protein
MKMGFGGSYRRVPQAFTSLSATYLLFACKEHRRSSSSPPSNFCTSILVLPPAINAQIKELEEELASIEEAAIAYAKAHGISKITGSEFVLKITAQTGLQFPGTREKGRENLERYLKKFGLWEQVSALDLKKLKKAIADGASDGATIRALLEFAEEEKASVRLAKKLEEKGVMAD